MDGWMDGWMDRLMNGWMTSYHSYDKYIRHPLYSVVFPIRYAIAKLGPSKTRPQTAPYMVQCHKTLIIIRPNAFLDQLLPVFTHYI
uniref:Uncharacterized protein n=1 Tax=Strigamia maritima TaxID=126957 RepID=T1JLI4_STRMM